MGLPNYLKTDADLRLYLEAYAGEDPGDDSLIRAALSGAARSGNFSALARDIGMTREGSYKALSENHNQSFAAVAKSPARSGCD